MAHNDKLAYLPPLQSVKPRVEKHVPIPPSRKLLDRLPLLDMEPGDSFLVPQDVEIRSSNIYRAAQRLNIKIRVRTTSKGPRVWRIK